MFSSQTESAPVPSEPRLEARVLFPEAKGHLYKSSLTRDLQHFPLVREPLSQPDQGDQVSSQDDSKQGYVNGIFVHKSLLQAEPHLNRVSTMFCTFRAHVKKIGSPQRQTRGKHLASQSTGIKRTGGAFRGGQTRRPMPQNLPVTPARMQTSSAHIDVSDCVSAHLTAPSVC